MENEILTGKNVNEAKKKVTDEEVDKLLKSAQEQLRKEIPVELTKEEREAIEKEKRKAEELAATKRREEQEAREKAEREAREREERAARIAKEKAEQEAREKAEREAREREARATRIAKEKAEQETAAAVVEEPYVLPAREAVEDKDRITVGRVIGMFFEAVWTLFKLVVVVSVVIGVVGFLLSRNYVVRGRCGDRQSLTVMTESSEALQNHMQEKENVKAWISSVKREKLHMEADDGKILVARQIVADNNVKQWAVILHGFNGSMEDVYDVAMHYAKEGYNVLLPDLRACGESEGSMIGMGWLDRMDVINWMDVILKDHPDAEIVIHGVDMGADTALMLSGEPLKSSVKAIVAESAYTSAWEVVKTEYKTRHEKWPTFPILNMVNPVLKIWAGYSLKEADATKQVKNATVPILLIQGGKDTYTTESMASQLEQAIASQHELLTIPDGAHGDCRYADPDTYYNKTFEFVGGYVE